MEHAQKMLDTKQDINRGYVGFIKSISSISQARTRKNFRSLLLFLYQYFGIAIRLSSVLLLYLYGVILIVCIHCKFAISGKRCVSRLHKDALLYVPEFIAQYPMHLYPILAKSLEMAFLKENLERLTPHLRGGIVELAIGDGTLSNRIFSEQDAITGFDLNPYSLIQTKKYRHIAQRIVGDCLNPPIESEGASLILSNNFLHHITNKEETLENWSRMAPYAIFNENTNYWAEGWLKPTLLKRMGLKKAAEKAVDHIANHSLQTLWKKAELVSLVRRFYDVKREAAFFHEKVFFLSAVCSALLFCYGPPTPELQKNVMNGILSPLTRRLTSQMAKALIKYDAILPRDRDVFICWALESKKAKQDFVGDRVILVCPDCRARLQGNRCSQCGRSFEERDGMLFLLPNDLMKAISFRKERAGFLGGEHL